MNSLLEESKKYKKMADELLAKSGLIPVLEKFGLPMKNGKLTFG
ncbi:MAG: hypothetical protein WC673_00860 [Candidatus Paceibacterota bacterium]|jgi:hypothetical protein